MQKNCDCLVIKGKSKMIERPWLEWSEGTGRRESRQKDLGQKKQNECKWRLIEGGNRVKQVHKYRDKEYRGSD